MANGDIGFSWQPGTPQGQPGGASGPRGISPQQAVKILSLRIPERPSARAITPQALLTSPGSAAPGAQGLDAAVAALMQVFRPQLQGGAPQVPSMPSMPQMPELSQASSDPVTPLFSPPLPQPVQAAPRPSAPPQAPQPPPRPAVPQQAQPQASPFQNAGGAQRRNFSDTVGGSPLSGGGFNIGASLMPRFIVERGPGGGQQDFHQSWDWGSFA